MSVLKLAVHSYLGGIVYISLFSSSKKKVEYNKVFDAVKHTIMFQTTMNASKHRNDLLQHAAVGVLLPRVVSSENVSTVCHHSLSVSVSAILLGER